MMIPSTAATNLQQEHLQQATQNPKVNASVFEITALDHTEIKIEATQSQEPIAITEINRSLQLAGVGVRFEFNQEAEKIITKVVDIASGEVIRQMPTEDVLRISKAIGKLQGLLVDQQI